MTDQTDRYTRFKALHEGPGAFVMPNPWDAGSARLLAAAGFDALATTSAGYAFSSGKPDMANLLTRDEVLANARQIVAATALPVSADLQNGFGHTPEDCAACIRDAATTGLVGGSIEDARSDPDDPIYDLSHATDRIRAAAEAARDLPFLLTARAENYLWGRPDLADTIVRLQAFAEAGADVLYAPGLPDIDTIATVCREVDRPVNVVMGLSGPAISVADLSRAGVRRISVGGSLFRTAMGAVQRAAEEMKRDGTFTYAADAIADARMMEIMGAP
ncbi:isocitrate lyase/PEP mutase family protein [Chachezhania antarctica]|uniref:isocitrate lyase/PEP mutase family protein n=1 Tax=Chachezhania antarctica TaxID=2340860 RepID=UPI000EB35D80|nr:isocitrate lyase/phosphoenolpyruvate mutase family protein [Chachezhania antarctica]|tara:strand:- start:20 stop:844 length:825 start_codon:yes stop_codon:yes gene_type:complete